MKVEKLVKENPKTQTELIFNFVFIKDGEIYLRLDDEPISLVDYIVEQEKELFDIDIPEEWRNPDNITDYLEGMDAITATFYLGMIGFAEVRERLKMYENGFKSTEE